MTESKEDGLLPCPFCGYAEQLDVETNDVGTFWVICTKSGCGCEGPYATSEAEAKAAWNRRASSPPVGGSGEVVVKPLEWGGCRTLSDGNWAFDAKTSIGWYIAASASGEGCKGTWKWFLVGGATLGWANSELEAKAAAQFHHDSAILSALAAPVPNGVPEGAIVNGRTLIDRLEHHYQFACEGGSLAMCSEWQDLVRCFEHLAEYAAASPVTPEGLSGGDPTSSGEPGETNQP